MSQSKNILKKIMEKGGIIGVAAGKYINDSKKAAAFIKECSEQCHSISIRQLWGEELVNEIIEHARISASKNKEFMQERHFKLKMARVIRVFRNNLAVSQEEMAEALHITKSNYSRLERGKRNISAYEIRIICKMFRLSPDQLFFSVEEAEDDILPSVSLVSFPKFIARLILNQDVQRDDSYLPDEKVLIKKVRNKYDKK